MKGFGCSTDEEQAALWIQKAANQGLTQAQFDLYSLYNLGIGVNKDINQSLYWLKQAAENDHALAKFEIAQLIENEAPLDAYELYQQAANLGCEEAKQKLREIEKTAGNQK